MPTVAVLHAVLAYTLLVHGTLGQGIFAKHLGYKISSTSARVCLVQEVQGVLQCEKLCLQHAEKCVAANVIFIKDKTYECIMFAELSVDSNIIPLLPIPEGKFIRRKDTEAERLTIESCQSSTIESTLYFCENVYDGKTAPGSGKEWAADEDDNNVWIHLDLGAVHVLTLIKIWWRCAGQSQFTQLYLSFSNGSIQKIRHECSSETDWLACSADDPPEVFNIRPEVTSFIHIVGVDCLPASGNNGFREIEIWGL